MTTEEKVLQILGDITDLPEGAGSHTKFDDLAMDSLDMAEFVLDVEEAFAISVPDNAVMSLQTIGEVVELVDETLAGE